MKSFSGLLVFTAATLFIMSGVGVAFASENRRGLPAIQAADASRQQPAVEPALTGTYRETGDHDEILIGKIMAATARLGSPDKEGQSRALYRILRAARLFAIEQYGTTITINYPDGTRIPYEADGKARLFRATGGETVSVRGQLSDNRLAIDLTWSGGERLRLIYEQSAEGNLTFTRVASNGTVPVPVSIVSEYERVSRRGLRKFINFGHQ
ncbi:MAG TPA: hypothetical protein VM911_19640 [Pyrinomonadaceae bacterium]|nr:hypothetical protein [Pyrinomonadaceae bacterium]